MASGHTEMGTLVESIRAPHEQGWCCRTSKARPHYYTSISTPSKVKSLGPNEKLHAILPKANCKCSYFAALHGITNGLILTSKAK